MNIEFRCEKCGKLLNMNAEYGNLVECPHCHKKIIVPYGLIPPTHYQTAVDFQQAETIEINNNIITRGMAYIMPWVISVFFHAGLFLILLFISMITIIKNAKSESVIIPAVALDTHIYQQKYSYNDKKTTQKYIKNSLYGRLIQDNHIREYAESTSIREYETDKHVELIGISRNHSIGSLAPWGEKNRLFPPAFFDKKIRNIGNIYHIVYVIDRSGSMVETFDTVRMEMLISIGHLSEIQDFHVILFSKGIPRELPTRRLVKATPRNKIAAAEFLNNCFASSQTDPIPALERAFSVLSHAHSRFPGKLIFFLTDGNFTDNNAVLLAIRQLNKNKNIHINTYLYGNRPPGAESVMKKIAIENGGIYKYISLDE